MYARDRNELFAAVGDIIFAHWPVLMTEQHHEYTSLRQNKFAQILLIALESLINIGYEEYFVISHWNDMIRNAILTTLRDSYTTPQSNKSSKATGHLSMYLTPV